MANSKLSALSSAGALGGTELAYLDQGGASVKVLLSVLKTFFSASPTFVTPTLGVATATSVAADTFTTTASNINAQTGTTYSLQASDNGKVVTLNNAGAITLTVPAGLGAGFSCVLVQLGAGQVTVTASGTTVNSYTALGKLAGQFASGALYAYAANVFELSGQLA